MPTGDIWTRSPVDGNVGWKGIEISTLLHSVISQTLIPAPGPVSWRIMLTTYHSKVSYSHAASKPNNS